MPVGRPSRSQTDTCGSKSRRRASRKCPAVKDIDAVGPSPASLVTTFTYDFNQNLVKITKPLTNTIEYDYDERNLKIATPVGGPTGSVTIMAYDGNENLTGQTRRVPERSQN